MINLVVYNQLYEKGIIILLFLLCKHSSRRANKYPLLQKKQEGWHLLFNGKDLKRLAFLRVASARQSMAGTRWCYCTR